MSLILPQRGRIRQAAAGGAAVTQQDIIDLNCERFYSLNDLANDVWQEAAKTNPADADTDPIALIEDLSGNASNAVQTDVSSPDYRPLLDIDGSINSFVLTGTASANEHLSVSLNVTTDQADCSLFMTVKTTDTKGILFNSTNNNYFCGCLDDGNTGATINSYASPVSGNETYVDGTLVTNNRDAFHTAVADGNWHVVECTHANFEAGIVWTLADTGFYAGGGGYELAGNLSDIVIINEAALVAGDGRVANTATIMSWLNAQVGL